MDILNGMLYSVTLLCALAVVETVECTYEIACDPSYSVKRHILCKIVAEINVFTVGLNCHAKNLSVAVLLLAIVDIGVYLVL